MSSILTSPIAVEDRGDEIEANPASNRIVVAVLLISGLVMVVAGLIAGIVASPIYFVLTLAGIFDLVAASFFSRAKEKAPQPSSGGDLAGSPDNGES